MPFKDESVDIFTGNLLMNVENYSTLIQEAYRCLKKGGKLAVIEIFFEHGSKPTNIYAQKERFGHPLKPLLLIVKRLDLNFSVATS